MFVCMLVCSKMPDSKQLIVPAVTCIIVILINLCDQVSTVDVDVLLDLICRVHDQVTFASASSQDG